jgi:hypothetical protein
MGRNGAVIHVSSSPSTNSSPESREPDVPVSGAYDLARRSLLLGLAAAGVVLTAPQAFADTTPSRDAFLAVSKLLTGFTSLDPGLAARLYDALNTNDPKFTAGVTALATLISQQNIDPLSLQATLDGTHSDLAALPRQIVTAWYMGVVGTGDAARCIAFETDLTNIVVSDKLTPPSFCFGAYGSWTSQPV